MTHALKLPWPPTINSYYHMGRRRTKRGRIYRDDVIKVCHDLGIGNTPYTGDLQASVYFFPPDKRIRDASNHTKALYDALTHAKLWEDDSLVKQEAYYMCEVVKKGLVYILIDELPYWEPLKMRDVIF
jgi:crossover junction endodeoxyribonuclease RusA